MTPSDEPNAGQMNPETLAKSEQTVADMEATLQRLAKEMARSRQLVDRLRQPPKPA